MNSRCQTRFTGTLLQPFLRRRAPVRSVRHTEQGAAPTSAGRGESFQTVLLLVGLLLCLANRTYASWDYGDGRHGSYVMMTNATIEQLYQAVRLTNDPVQYNPFDTNAIPNFQGLTITNNVTLTANPWNGSTGGWIVLKVRGTLFIAANSAISASGIGYRGGGWGYSGTWAAGIQGESYAGFQAISQSANYGGGGGGRSAGGGQTYGGGGGGYGTSGSNADGVGGSTYGSSWLDTVYLGSGGGGAGGFTSPGGGSGGGGAIVLNAGYLIAQGKIQANGGDAGFGGAGSGGSILLRLGSAVIGTNNITALGGAPAPGVYSFGGGGGVGRIAINYAAVLQGSTTPAPYTLNDTNSDSIQITNQPTSQTNFLGDSVLFSVGFTTVSPHSLQWFFNGSAISGATNQTLSLPNLSLTNQGSYWLLISNPVVTITSSALFLTVLDTNMPFSDGIPNWWKLKYGLSTNDPTLATSYPPGDQLTYLQKYVYGLNPLTNDTDGDGLTDYSEIFIYHTNPLSTNTAGDGIPDAWKVQHGVDPLISDANNEIGSSGVTYWQVYQYDLTHTNQLDPRNPFFAPGTSIYDVINSGQHTNRFYYDHNNRLVGLESSRGISIAYQYDGNDNLIRQTVLSRAAETNGLPVLWRFLNGLTNNTSPYADSDGDGWTDYQEWMAGTNPNDPNSVPNILGVTGTNAVSFSPGFSPSNFVMGSGQLDGIGADEIVIGADGNPGSVTNSLLILTQQTTDHWSTNLVPIGPVGITSIAIGQVSNAPSPAIYIGTRNTGGTGTIVEVNQGTNGWVTTPLSIGNTSQVAYVLGVRPNSDLLAHLSLTNAPDQSLYSLTVSNGTWGAQCLATASSRRGLGTVALTTSNDTQGTSLRLLDEGAIQLGYGSGTNGLMAYWSFDAGNAHDDSGNEVNGARRRRDHGRRQEG